MDPSDEQQRARWREWLAAPVCGRRVVCALGPLAYFTEIVDLLERVGARRPLVVATGTGAGPVPTPDQADIVMLDLPDAESMTEDLRRHDATLRSAPAALVDAVTAYDPDGTAVWLVGAFVSDLPLLGREVLGGRPAAWLALEDKTVADELWQAVGAPHAPSRVVPVDRLALAAASADLDEGSGTVWSGDARDGFNGGGDFVRWVADEEGSRAAGAFFADRCDRVRVMPFLDGVPCSVHGMVLPDGTAAFRPVELAILRRPDRRFVYGGLGTGWDPPEADRAQMRELVRRTGELLRSRVGYRGAFGIDGVLGVDGFRPTELNTRVSAGLTAMGRFVDAGLFTLLQLALVTGRDPGVDVAALEAWALPELDRRRFVKPAAMSQERVLDGPVELAVAWDGSSLTTTDDPSTWRVAAAPNPAGTYCRLDVPTPAGQPGPGSPGGPATHLHGLRVADLNVALMGLLDEELGTGFGDVSAPPDVRR